MAVGSPQPFAEVLAELGNCPGCSLALISEAVYTLAGLVSQQETEDWPADDDDEEVCRCERPVVPEVISMRATLAMASGDEEVLAATLAEPQCRLCLLSVLVATTRAHLAVLDGTKAAWRPALEEYLLSVLDGG